MFKITTAIKKTENILQQHFAGQLNENKIRQNSISMIGALHVFTTASNKSLFTIKKELLSFRDCYINMIDLFEDERDYSNIYNYMGDYFDNDSEAYSKSEVMSEFPVLFDQQKQCEVAEILLNSILNEKNYKDPDFILFMKKFSLFIVYSYVEASAISIFSHFIQSTFDCDEETFSNIIINETTSYFKEKLDIIYGKSFSKEGFLLEHIFWSIPCNCFIFFRGAYETYDFQFSDPKNQFVLYWFPEKLIEAVSNDILSRHLYNKNIMNQIDMLHKMKVLVFYFLQKIIKNRAEDI